MATLHLSPVNWQRMSDAVDKVRHRLLHVSACLKKADVPYAVIGENAVAAWVSRVEEAGEFMLISLHALVRMKLAAWLDKDRMHLRDLTDVGLLDRAMVDTHDAQLSERLLQILDNPE